ncbi:Choline transport protein [Lachnellula subtilissima]|uniref:Choline transport protein n=1 Tax=Lachnellula subtilissima TaxID=602034 RepID=A0A8H8UAT4_9HELO|nr:Choline transport protein [Lachnellula subtilissima]
MAFPKNDSPSTSPLEWDGDEASDNDSTAGDSDAAKLAQMGYAQGMKRKFSVWSLLGVGFSLTNSWFGISTALVTGINSGGPVLIVYGIMLIALVSTCVGISLSELASALPNAGGQYFWAGELAPKGYGKFASYLTGWFAWAGSIFTSASVSLGLGSAIVGCIQLTHPTLEIRPWMVVLAYELVNAFAFIFNFYGRHLPRIATFTLWFSLLSFTTILITVPSTATTHQSPRFVFAHFENNTGWDSNTIAFIVGLINTNWAFACLDCATHLAEEVQHPERTIPIAIMGTIAIGFATSWLYSISMFFSMSSLPLLFNTPTKVPILELFHQALSSRRGAVALECAVIVTGLGCLIASHTWQSRLCWSFARDGGIPGSRWLAEIHPVLDGPFNAHVASCSIVAVLGLLYLGSHTAFNSMVTACIVLLYVSYSIPVLCLLVRGRDSIRHGPFWAGRYGLVANWVLLAWTAFTLVMYSFPPVMPVNAGNMNYVCVVYVLVLGAVLVYWRVRGKKTYRNREESYEEVAGNEEAIF